jgi:hypothetical protein
VSGIDPNGPIFKANVAVQSAVWQKTNQCETSMIYAAISHITGQLNQHLKRAFDLNEDIVAVANITEQDGTVTVNTNNKIVASLVNVERETTPGCRPPAEPATDLPAAQSHPPIHTNLYLLFAGNFNGKNYGEALKFLSATISFFQRNPLFTNQNSPNLDHRITRIALEIENLNFKDLSSLWTVLSGKYLPSVLYKIRMITFDARDIVGRAPKIIETRVRAHP